VLLGHLRHRRLVGFPEDLDHLLLSEPRLLHDSLAVPGSHLPRIKRSENRQQVNGGRRYAYGKVYAALEERGIEAVIPAKAEPAPTESFLYADSDMTNATRSCVARPARS